MVYVRQSEHPVCDASHGLDLQESGQLEHLFCHLSGASEQPTTVEQNHIAQAFESRYLCIRSIRPIVRFPASVLLSNVVFLQPLLPLLAVVYVEYGDVLHAQ
ncbi:hypothetical protein D3C74_454250 [compost metagenome]